MLKDTEKMMHDRGKKVKFYCIKYLLTLLFSIIKVYCIITYIFTEILQPHRPKAEGGGGRHKKRVRQPYSTRERQRQLATQHGEYIMPQNNSHYRAPHQVTYLSTFFYLL